VSRAAATCVLVLAAVLAGPGPAAAQLSPPPLGLDAAAGTKPAALREVEFEQRMGAGLPLDAAFRDETGAPVALGSYFGRRPVLVSLVYYDCPMLCGMATNGLAASLKPLAFVPGREFEVVTVSFDPAETPAQAAAAKENALARYGRDRAGAAAGWHFLTGDAEAIRRLTEAVGFRYRYDEARGEFAHPTGVVVATPDGRVGRYLFGIDYPPKDLRLGLVEAGQGLVGSPVDQLLLYCYHYDPATGKYTAAVLNLVRAGGVATLAALAAFLVVMRRRERRLAAAAPVETA
jgi:protein SCO1/2